MSSPARGASWSTTRASWPRRRTVSRSAASALPDAAAPVTGENEAIPPAEQGLTPLDASAEIGDLVSRLSGDEKMDRETRGRLLARLARLLGASARQRSEERRVGKECR